jgi:hypothetical protein
MTKNPIRQAKGPHGTKPPMRLSTIQIAANPLLEQSPYSVVVYT